MPRKCFAIYAREDQAILKKVITAFKTLQRHQLDVRYDSRTELGADWDPAIRAMFEESEIVFLLVSPDFFASSYIQEVELPRAHRARSAGAKVVIPLFARHCPWDQTSIAGIEGAPFDDNYLVEEGQFSDERMNEVCRLLIETLDARFPRESVPTQSGGANVPTSPSGAATKTVERDDAGEAATEALRERLLALLKDHPVIVDAIAGDEAFSDQRILGLSIEARAPRVVDRLMAFPLPKVLRSLVRVKQALVRRRTGVNIGTVVWQLAMSLLPVLPTVSIRQDILHATREMGVGRYLVELTSTATLTIAELVVARATTLDPAFRSVPDGYPVGRSFQGELRSVGNEWSITFAGVEQGLGKGSLVDVVQEHLLLRFNLTGKDARRNPQRAIRAALENEAETDRPFYFAYLSADVPEEARAMARDQLDALSKAFPMLPILELRGSSAEEHKIVDLLKRLIDGAETDGILG